MLRAKVRGPQSGFVCTARVHYGNTGVVACVSNLKFWGGVLSCIPLTALSLSMPILGLLSGEHLGVSLINGNQNKAAMAQLGVSPFTFDFFLNPSELSFLSPPFLLASDLRRWGHRWFQSEPIPFSFLFSMPFLCSPLAKDFLVPLSVWAVP